MKALILVALLSLVVGCAAARVEPPTPEPSVKQMFEDSQLLKCDGLKCMDVGTGVEYKNTVLHNGVVGYVVNFPEGKYTTEQVQRHSDAIAKMYIHLLTYLPPPQ